MVQHLPDELWLDIFESAVDDAEFFEPTLPDAFSASTCAQEGVNNAQRRSYATKKAIMATCRTWRRLGYEFFYRFLFFSNPLNMQRLCRLLDTDSDLGHRTRRLHVIRYFDRSAPTAEVTQNSLVSIISRCENLETFIVNWPLAIALPAVANALCTYTSQTLRVLQLTIPTAALAKFILLLDGLPKLESVHVEFDGPAPEQVRLGSAGDLELSLPCLQHLSARGSFQDFIEQATDWNFPVLRSLSLDFTTYREDFPDVLDFLAEHGSELTTLDLNCIPPVDVAAVLDLCPLLTTFTFNPDWRLPGWDDPTARGTHLVRSPHQHITTVGLHHLMYAFGVGYATNYNEINPFIVQSIQRQNDANFAALTRASFPRLARVRVLNPTLLADLEKNNGPSKAGLARWDRWTRQCTAEGVRLEDCTGATLGTLPEYEDEDGDEYTDDGASTVGGNTAQPIRVLRELVAECQRANAQRELDVPTPLMRMIYTSTYGSS
ncbi:uncharacterized protein BXZ73DRAFT_87049 [Epithele typhae]|uniref:uncharacterized protein n=1 Tax=Epithele typhae TaxID=378194 RepID=UPI002007B63B|nr:uncharacterized protein BXZ73DRAFT_87049 [Epithele typhae]KAH9944087.1 hypothetical protein BXZ73DRAFT_87049 [Epithele typhae]